MATEMTRWMAEMVLLQIQGETRARLLTALREDPVYVTTIIVQDIKSLERKFIKETGKTVIPLDDTDPDLIQATRIVEYLRERLLTEETAFA